MNNFIDYVLKFYGTGGTYDLAASKIEVSEAIEILLSKKDHSFAGDSFDRELVRDIILESRGERPWGIV